MEPPRIQGDKHVIRKRIWRILLEKGVAKPPFPIEGRIPNFKGAEKAAEKLFKTRIWRKARILKVNPDSPQRPVRLRALIEGKLLLMPTPRIRRGFILLDPNNIPRTRYNYASTIKGAFKLGKILQRLNDIRNTIESIDLIVEGSVAVSTLGDRLGKGHGYGDLEYGILAEIGIIDDKVPIATTVHDLQVLEEKLPQDPHDVPVNTIATPTRLINIENTRTRPPGILWDRLDKRKLLEIPILRELAGEQGIG